MPSLAHSLSQSFKALSNKGKVDPRLAWANIWNPQINPDAIIAVCGCSKTKHPGHFGLCSNPVVTTIAGAFPLKLALDPKFDPIAQKISFLLRTGKSTEARSEMQEWHNSMISIDCNCPFKCLDPFTCQRVKASGSTNNGHTGHIWICKCKVPCSFGSCKSPQLVPPNDILVRTVAGLCHNAPTGHCVSGKSRIWAFHLGFAIQCFDSESDAAEFEKHHGGVITKKRTWPNHDAFLAGMRSFKSSKNVPIHLEFRKCHLNPRPTKRKPSQQNETHSKKQRTPSRANSTQPHQSTTTLQPDLPHDKELPVRRNTNPKQLSVQRPTTSFFRRTASPFPIGCTPKQKSDNKKGPTSMRATGFTGTPFDRATSQSMIAVDASPEGSNPSLQHSGLSPCPLPPTDFDDDGFGRMADASTMAEKRLQSDKVRPTQFKKDQKSVTFCLHC